MAPRNDPSALQWLVGNELARFRKNAGKTLKDLVDDTGITKPKLAYMEAGKFQQQTDDVEVVLNACGASTRDIDRVCSLAGRGTGKSWWAPWSDIVPDWFRTYVGLEGLAESVFAFEPLIIPGVLQTMEYAEAVTRSTSFVRRDYAERFANFRQARAERLTSENDPLQFTAVIGESALRLKVGTVDERRRQLEHLLAMTSLPNIDIQILRPEDGPHPAIEIGQFMILQFDLAQPIAYSGLFDGAVYIQDLAGVQTYRMSADDLRAVAQPSAESVDIIKQAMTRI